MKPLKVYAGYNTDKDVRLSSSSGGILTGNRCIGTAGCCIWRCHGRGLLLSRVYFRHKQGTTDKTAWVKVFAGESW